MRALVFGVATFGLNHDWHFSWHSLKEISEVISSDVLPHFIANLFFRFSKGIFFSFSCHFQMNEARKLYSISNEDHGAHAVFKDSLGFSSYEVIYPMLNVLAR